MSTLKLGLTLFFISLVGLSFAQKKQFGYFASVEGIVSSEDELPFYFRANQHDRIPDNDTYGFIGGIFSPFERTEADFDYAFTGSFSSYGGRDSKTQINELFGSIRYKKFLLEVGSKFPEVNYGGLSISNGSFARSLNARAFPGINIKTKDYLKIGSWFGLKANYGEYFLDDPRYTENTMVHNKSLHFRFYPSENWSFNFGLDHYAQWAGTSPEYGKLPATFNDYLRVIFAQKGSEDTNDNERINVLGNHLGNHLFEVTYNKNIKLNLYWSHPFEDNSGLSLKNTSDGIFGVFVDFKKPQGFVSQLVFEYVNTLDQGKAKSSAGFIDNYFSNSIYRSGWTYHTTIIGNPLFRVKTKEWDGVEYIGINNDFSRMQTFHLGFKGKLSQNLFYKTLLTYTDYPGWFRNPQDAKILSGMINLDYTNPSIPFIISGNFGFDTGSASNNPIAFGLQISKQGLF